VSITAFPSGQPHGGSEFYQRLLRAHANCVENLPVFAALVLAHSLAGAAAPSIATAASLVLWGRVGQSLAHWTSTKALWVHVRFGFFAVQVLGLVSMALDTAPAL
jgi:uncharacterized MAPEG superfamily protein